MQIKINGHVYTMYNRVNVNLKYDHVSDLFNFLLYFDPDNADHRADFRPGSYPECTILHADILLMTGIILRVRFSSAGDPAKQLVSVSGFCKTGVLDKSCVLNTNNNIDAAVQVLNYTSKTVIIPPAALQFDGLTLQQIAVLVVGFYELKVIVDDELAKDRNFNVPFPTVIASNDTDFTKTTPEITVYAFLKGLCDQKNVVLSHDQYGNLLLTRPKVDKIATTSYTYVGNNVNQVPRTADIAGAPSFNAPQTTAATTSKSRKELYNFFENDPALAKRSITDPSWVGMALDFDGQDMHRFIQIVGQKGDKPDNALDSAISNPFVAPGTLLYTRIIQKAGDDIDSSNAARKALGDELLGIVVTIDIQGWTLGGNLVLPNQIVTITNRELGLYSAGRWFIQEVDFYGDEKEEVATLTCVLPFCFGNNPVINNYFQ